MRINSIFFDLYGTLLDVEVEEYTESFWSTLSEELKESSITIASPDLQFEFFSLLEDERSRAPDGFVMNSLFQRLLAQIKGTTDSREVEELAALFRAISIKRLELKPYTEALLGEVKRSGCRIAIVSNTEAILTRYDLNQYPLLLDLDALVLSSEIGVKKPDPRIFSVVLNKIGTSPESTIFVGDNFEEDISGAHRMGLPALYINSGENTWTSIPGSPSIIQARPELESILNGLRILGWKSAAQS